MLFKKIVGLAASLPFLALGVMGGTGVSADSFNPSIASNVALGGADSPIKISVSREGHTIIEGIVVAQESSGIVVRSWGGDWKVGAGSSVKLNRYDGSIASMGDFHVGDSVRVEGRSAAGDLLGVNAALIKNRTKANRYTVVAPVAAAPLQYSGTVSDINPRDKSFWLNTREGHRMHVFANDQTTLDGQSNFFSRLTQGMNLSLNGRNSGQPGNVLALTLAAQGNLNVVNARGNANLDNSVTDNSNSNNRTNVDASDRSATDASDRSNTDASSRTNTDASDRSTTDASDNSRNTSDSGNTVDASTDDSGNSALGSGI